MVGLLIPSATTSTWTGFPASYCNCEIQDGVQDGRRDYASTLKKHSRVIFPVTLLNVNRFSIFSPVDFHKTCSGLVIIVHLV